MGFSILFFLRSALTSIHFASSNRATVNKRTIIGGATTPGIKMIANLIDNLVLIKFETKSGSLLQLEGKGKRKISSATP